LTRSREKTFLIRGGKADAKPGIADEPGKEEVPRGQPVAALIVGGHRQGHRAN